MKRVSPILVLAFLLVLCLSLATVLQPRAARWSRSAESGTVLKILLGDGRRLFANQFFVQADVSFHSGYYPSVFDTRDKPKPSAMQTGQMEHNEAEHEREMALAPPHDWIEAFGRHFRVTEHTHLKQGQEREILPWLKLSAELDPQRVETYTVASYWLRKRLGKVQEAEQFLREGLRNNPDSYEILYELGCLYAEDKHEPEMAKNLWELALARWNQKEAHTKDPDTFQLEQITVRLASLEEQAGNYPRAISLFERAKSVSPHPGDLQKRIDELRSRAKSPP